MRAKLTPKHNNQPRNTGGITLDDFLSRLDKVRKMGQKYIARCPAHVDGRPSLQVSQGEKGILVRCYAGCLFNEIVSAMGLLPGDLFTDSLTDERRAEYEYRGIGKQIRKLETLVDVCAIEMKNGTISDGDREIYGAAIEKLIRLRNEYNQLKREYGFR